MNRQTVTVTNEMGMNGRFTAQFVPKANQFKSDITLRCNGKEADGKKVIPVCKLGAVKGSEVQITATGTDEKEAIESLTEMILHAEVYAGDVGREKQSAPKRSGFLSRLLSGRGKRGQTDDAE